MSETCECECCCDDCCSEKKHERLTGTVLKCGSPGFVAFDDTTVVGTTRTLTALQINTSEFENPCIQLSVTANIYIGALGGYNFQIFRLCSDQAAATPVSGIYGYSRLVATTETDSFNFTVCDCDCDSCMEGCCTYFVVVTVAVPIVLESFISNVTLSAIVSENGCDC